MDTNSTKRRDEILEEMRQISRMRQGGVSEQHYSAGQGKDQRRQGPYYLLQGWRDGKHWSKRVSRDDAKQVRDDVNACERFQALCREFAEITEKATVSGKTVDSKKNYRR